MHLDDLVSTWKCNSPVIMISVGIIAKFGNNIGRFLNCWNGGGMTYDFTGAPHKQSDTLDVVISTELRSCTI